jgi:hypothetical protein
VSRTPDRPAVRWAVVAAAACVVSAGLAVPSQAAPAGSRCTNELSGSNVLRSNGSTSVEVSLDDTTSLSAARPQNPDFDIVAPGDGLAGFVLRQIGPEEPLVVVAGRLPTTPAFGPDAKEIVFVPGRATGEAVELPAGRYELQVASERRALLKLRLHGLDGSSRLCSGRSQDAAVGSLDPAVEAPGSFWAGDSREWDRPSLALFAIAVTGDAWAAGQYGACVHEDVLDAPQQLRHSPHCPLSGSAVVNYSNDLTARLEHRTVYVGTIDGIPAGARDLSMWVTGVPPSDRVEAVRAWLPRSS